MIDPFILNSKIDIPFVGAKVSVHQPTLKEIAYIGGQDVLFPGCELLRISKDIFTGNDKIDSEYITDFDILMQIILMHSPELEKPIESAKLVLELLFPQHIVRWNPPFQISLKQDDNISFITKDNFEELKQIIAEMFCLTRGSNTPDFNPLDERAAQIAEKIKQRYKKLAQMRGESGNSSIFDRYISILAVGLQKDKNDLMEYSVYQLFDEFDRFQAKMAYDIYVQAKMAGAQDIEEVENWMKDLHSNGSTNDFYV